MSPVVGNDEEIEVVKNLCIKAGDDKVFPNPSKNADIHSYRAAYAQRIDDTNKREYKDFNRERLIIYKNHVADSYTTKNGKRDASKFPHLYIDIGGRKKMLPGYKDVSAAFYCRNDLKGTVDDRRALFEASRALGHNRETVVAEH